MAYPAEGQNLPALRETFVFGEVTPGSTLTINGTAIPVHPKGGYLAMVPVQTGPMLLILEATTPAKEKIRLDRHFTIAPGFIESPVKPLTLVKESIEPSEDIVLSPGDPLRVFFQGSPGQGGEFSIQNIERHVPAVERLGPGNSTETARGLYEGNYIIQPDDKADRADIEVWLHGHGKQQHARARGRLTIESGAIPRVGIITDEVAAVRSGAEGGYDLFLYKGMRVRLTGRMKGQRRVRLSTLQSGWIKESSVQELPRGTALPKGLVTNMVMSRQDDSTLLRIPLDDWLPYRTEQFLDPMQLVVTLYGAVDKTDLIRYDPADPLIRQVRWRQVGPDSVQIIIEPRFTRWGGYDVRYEGNSLIIEVRKPWTKESVKGMTIAIDAGHGGPELGAMGPHGTLEKDANLAMARVVRATLEDAGARVVMTRDSDMDVPLYERSRIAWRNRAQLFISIHSNSSGAAENPLITNGSSVYFYHPQSLALARAVHAQYPKRVGLADRGLFYSDFAVNRMSQMPAILTEQAYIIVPEQEQLLFSPAFHRKVAQAILDGIQNYLEQK